MKRYDPGTVTDEYDMVEDELGDYVLYSEANDKIASLSNKLVEVWSVFESVYNALDGKPISDFMLSFDVVRKVADVRATMIPRPDPEEARRAVSDLLLAYNRLTFAKADGANPKKQEDDYQQHYAALLRLLGVEE